MKCLKIVTAILALNFFSSATAVPQQPSIPWPLPPNFGQEQPSPPTPDGQLPRPPTSSGSGAFGFLDIFGNIFNSIWSSIPRIIGIFQPQNRPPPNQPNNQLPPFPGPLPFPVPSVSNQPTGAQAHSVAAAPNQPNMFAQWTGFQQPAQNQKPIDPSAQNQQLTQNPQFQLPNPLSLLPAQFGSGQANAATQTSANSQNPGQKAPSVSANNQPNVLSQLTGFNRPSQETPILAGKPPTSNKNNSNSSASSPPKKNPVGSEALKPLEDD